jgi:hypothetical protein
MSKILPVASLAALIFIAGCKTGYNRTYSRAKDPNPPPCAEEASNPNLTAEGRRVFKMLAGLTCSEIAFDGYVMGQNAGFGNQIATETSDRSYARLISDVKESTTHTPGLVAIDYEYDEIFTLEELKDANEKLKAHWGEGGLVSISWMPRNPWDSETLLHTDDVDLEALIDDSTEIHEEWRERVDVIAAALKDLKDAGVPVLWRPLPEMNRDAFWWGTTASHITGSANDASLYTNLWEDMYEYFKTKGLDNLLWVYSPGESKSGVPGPTGKSATWAYPGVKFVDVVAGIARNDALDIPDYQALIDLKHPFGMAEYSPLHADMGGTFSGTNKKFNARLYVDRLSGSYRAAGFWVSWHSFDTPTTENENLRSHLALIDSDRLKDLIDTDTILSIERIKEKKLLD